MLTEHPHPNLAPQPPRDRPRNGLVVSDLHLFSRRSAGERLFAQLEAATADTDTLVLNGDTFDFRWSHLPSEAHSVHAALEWLAELVERRPRRDVHYLLGNHDCLEAFRQPLDELAARTPRLHCHAERLQLGDCLFLHGDCANRPMDGAALARFRRAWSRDRRRPAALAAVYQKLDALGVSRRFHDWYFPPRRVVARVAHHLDRVLPGWPRQVRHCYLGHTHRPFRDLDWRGVRFSNTGSAIHGMGFQPLSFTWT